MKFTQVLLICACLFTAINALTPLRHPDVTPRTSNYTPSLTKIPPQQSFSSTTSAMQMNPNKCRDECERIVGYCRMTNYAPSLFASKTGRVSDPCIAARNGCLAKCQSK